MDYTPCLVARFDNIPFFYYISHRIYNLFYMHTPDEGELHVIVPAGRDFAMSVQHIEAHHQDSHVDIFDPDKRIVTVKPPAERIESVRDVLRDAGYIVS